MFAPGGILAVKQNLANLARRDPIVHVRVKFVSGRQVHTDRGVFHYSELEVPKTLSPAPRYTASLPAGHGKIPERLHEILEARRSPP